jgi:hypothetical protein
MWDKLDLSLGCAEVDEVGLGTYGQTVDAFDVHRATDESLDLVRRASRTRVRSTVGTATWRSAYTGSRQ